MRLNNVHQTNLQVVIEGVSFDANKVCGVSLMCIVQHGWQGVMMHTHVPLAKQLHGVVWT